MMLISRCRAEPQQQEDTQCQLPPDGALENEHTQGCDALRRSELPARFTDAYHEFSSLLEKAG